MYSETPPLPSRKAISPELIIKQGKYLKDRPCYLPSALYIHLETNEEGHKHDFYHVVPQQDEASFSPDDEVAKIADTTIDENIITLDPNTKKTRYICRSCHVCLDFTHTKIDNADEHNKCKAAGYPCHHYHSSGINIYQCCGCNYTIEAEFQDPVLQLRTFRLLESTRVKSISYAQRVQNHEEQRPSLFNTYKTLLIYIKNLIELPRKDINTRNTKFLGLVGLDEGSKEMFEEIGFVLHEDHLIPPEIEPCTPQAERLDRISQEILAELYASQETPGSNSSSSGFSQNCSFKLENTNHQSLFGILPNLEKGLTNNDEYLAQAYAVLGLTTGASDTLVAWTYNTVLKEPTILINHYDALDALVTMANLTHSVNLQTMVAVERSKGKIGRNDIGDAYAYFGVSEDSVDDGLLIGLYKVKLSDEPFEKNTIQEKLKTIAIARNSTELIQFLKEEKGIVENNTHSVEETMGVPSHLIHNIRQAPVGLNNIGNTCYFNSVLQYYFTLLPFRETIVNNDAFIEDDNSEPKKIGGIEVDQSEVLRAKKFVGLLKGLFENLATSQDKALSPEYELAYMALLNEKEEETEPAQVSQPNDISSSSSTFIDNNTTTLSDDAEPGLPVLQATPVSTFQDKDTEQAELPLIAETKADLPEEKDTELEIVKESLDTFITTPSADTITTADDTSSRPNSPPPAYSDIAPTEEQVEFVNEKKEKSAVIPVKQPTMKERPSVDTMMFGKQQDVTECMGNVMYLVEAALKPLSKTEDGEQVDDMIRQVFYGKACQILSYRDNETSQLVKKEMEEDFSHVIVDASKGKDLYDGLDENFFAGQVENFQGGREAIREVTVKNFPPVLQILVQRVQFDRATANVYKSNAYIKFEKIIYLDRYADENFEQLKGRRLEVTQWRSELEKYKQQVDKYTKSEICKMPIPDLLNATCKVLEDRKSDSTPQEQAQIETVVAFMRKEAEEKTQLVQQGREMMNELCEKIQTQYQDYTKIAYQLHAVFIHQGQANYGHYWIYIYDHLEDQWWKYNDSLVTKARESEIYHDTTGSTANPYFLVYVDKSKVDELVVSNSRPSRPSSSDTHTDTPSEFALPA